ncbi:MAG: Stage III sporulation protein AH [Firmicutes bacterium ADurb.Bin419]|nr:MAG: Stage III sporulation protein AH [Firmicutes bacterium ADurb.Bin419]
MVVFKRKQIVVLSLVLMIVIAGYLQYSYKKSSISVSEMADSDSPRLGEAVYVDNFGEFDSETAEKSEDSDKKENKKEENKKEENKKTVQASKMANDFFAQAKMDRDVTRGKNKDELQNITKDPEASKELKSQASEKMLAIIDNSEKEMAIETLIKEKGFSDVVVFIADDKSLDIVVKAQNITDAEATQIADIAARQANVSIADVHVRPIF